MDDKAVSEVGGISAGLADGGGGGAVCGATGVAGDDGFGAGDTGIGCGAGEAEEVAALIAEGGGKASSEVCFTTTSPLGAAGVFEGAGAEVAEGFAGAGPAGPAEAGFDGLGSC